MNIRPSWMLLAVLAAWSCGGGDAGSADVPAGQTADQATENTTAGGGEYSRESFVLCEAIEGHREELAGIVGFEPDLEREIQGVGAQCSVRGTDFGFVSLEVPPAIMSSIAMYARGFDGETNPVPALGEDAVFVDAGLQPHIVFELGGLIIDVGAEAGGTPSRETMIDLATRIRDLLVEANP